MQENIKNKFFKLRDKIIDNRYKKLNEYQKNAVVSNERNLAVIACPGAGKTTTLINKIDYLVKFGPIYKTYYCPDNINEKDIVILENYLKGEKFDKNRFEILLGGKKVNPSNIIVITFTKAAALNMKKKYIDITKEDKIPFFGTFHGLFYKILIRKYKKIDIISSSQAYKIIKEVLYTYLDEVSEERVKEILNSISYFKTSNIELNDIDDKKLNIDKDIFLQCYKNYEEYKSKNNLLDFDDLQTKSMELFRKDIKILDGYRKLFKYMLVDEFQDCDTMQIDILKLLNHNNSIFAVGDEDQCIYGFRGANPKCIVKFDENFKNGKKLFLSINYRCSKNIVNISNNLIKNNKLRNNKDMYAFKDEDTKVNILNYKNQGLEAEDIASRIIKLQSFDKFEFKDVAILYRTNVESRSIVDAFIRKKIPFKLLDKKFNFFEHFICKDLLCYLRLSIDSRDKDSFLRIINRPFRYISKLDIDKIRKNNIKDDCFDMLKLNENIPPFQLKKIDDLKRDIQNLNKMSLAGAINSILKDLNYMEYLRDYSIKFKLNFEELEEIAEEFASSALEFNTIINFLIHVEEVKDTIDKNKEYYNDNSVTLSTIHGVKGMEFKNVFIINCNEEIIPHINSIDYNLEEERRLFYVGITRAIDNIWILSSSEVRGKGKLISRFIRELNVGSLIKDEFNKGDIVKHNTFGRGHILKIDDNIIEIKFDNGNIRTFDSIILYTNGLINKI